MRVDNTRRAQLYGVLLVAGMVALAGAVNGSCVFGTSTNLCEMNGLRCNEGQECATTEIKCVAAGGCGNGVVNRGEVCDDGNTISGDGCGSDCKSNERCGNGIVDDYGADSPIHEACDPVDTGLAPPQDTAGCNSDCTLPRCGDGHVNPRYVVVPAVVRPGHTEECDPGGGADTATCNVDCSIARCGDGYTNVMAGEDCDDGEDNSDLLPDRCRTSCRSPRCGDGVQDQGEECDSGTANNDQLPDSCRTNCHEPGCGDNVVDRDQGEQCDNGVNNSDTVADACRKDCRLPRCGDDVKDTGEDCDPPGSSCTSGTCSSSCHCM